MLQLKNITKTYITGNEKIEALKGIDIEFRKSEFVSILGQSGCGKTTLLNIIGGLDRYTSGDLIINGKSTKDFKDRDWDAYRNYSIGFVFQNYNLITHQTVLSNVELALTISGVSRKEKRNRAIKALEEVGLKDKINKKPNQLSGGQMQRVAIARALVNNPDIILADEPTGALDTKTSEQVMDILKEISKDKLIIMVTHNAELAEKYSTRIIRILDGKITDDSNPYKIEENNALMPASVNRRTSMKFFTAFRLSLNNLMTKKGRTILTSFAGSIGIIGIALILSLSSGVQNYINRVQEEALTSYPLTIEDATIDITSAIVEGREKALEEMETESSRENNRIYSNNTITDTMAFMSSQAKANNLESFKSFIESGDSNIKDFTTAISYAYDLDLQLYKSDVSGDIQQVNPNTVLESIGIPTMAFGNQMMVSDVWIEMFENEEINSKMYEVLSGEMPQNYNEVVLLVDENNRISDYVLYALGLKDQNELEELYRKVNNGEEIETTETSYSYEELIGLSYKLLLNTDYYEQENNIWADKSEDEEYLRKKLLNAEEVTVVGIVKPSEDWSGTVTAIGGILYTDALEKYVIAKINDSEIVKEQQENPNVNVLTGLEFSDDEFSFESLSDEQKLYLQSLSPTELAALVARYNEQAGATYESVLSELGFVDLDRPAAINIYASDFNSKEEIKDIIDDYNQSQRNTDNEGNVITYTDIVGLLMSSVTSIVDMISYVLIAFVSISLVVSSIMIGIITYISVLERTKEIGILRAIGASKKDISRVFNAETLIVGLSAGILGIWITILLNIPINAVIESVANVRNLSNLPVVGGIILIFISVILTMIAGLIPAKIASKKDPVEALRTE